MASLKDASVDEENDSQQDSPESYAPAVMARDILQFMDASPESLLNIAQSSDSNDAFGDVFGSFLLCITSPRDDIRRRASSVAKRLFTQPRILEDLRVRKKHVPAPLKLEFWRRRCVLATTLPSCSFALGEGANDGKVVPPCCIP